MPKIKVEKGVLGGFKLSPKGKKLKPEEVYKPKSAHYTSLIQMIRDAPNQPIWYMKYFKKLLKKKKKK